MKQKYLFPTILIAGIAIYYFVTKKAVPAQTTQPVTDPGITDAGYIDPQLAQAYTDSALNPALQTAIKNYIQSQQYNAGVQTYQGATSSSILTGNSAVDQQLKNLSSYFPASSPFWATFKTMDAVSLGNLYNLTAYFPIDHPYWNTFIKMTPAEIASAWYYVGTYLSRNIPLLNATKQNSDGTWDNTNPGNPDLYNKILAIHTKYGIF